MSKFVPLVPSRSNGILHVALLGRKSKPNPNNENESIEASMESAEQYLGRVYEGPAEIIRLGEQISGMVVDRATIRQVEDLREAKEVDLILTEDIGRIFRNPRHIMGFVQDCVDAEVRLIAVADNLDTADENWETALSIAAIRHGFVVPDARRRVKRSAKYSFKGGGNVQHVKFGYRKVSKEDAKSGRFGPVGLRIAKIPDLTATIKEICKKVKDIENYRSYDDIADFLEENGISPGPSCRSGHWSGKLVVSLVRDEILMGVRILGKTKTHRQYKSGAKKQRRNKTPLEKTSYPELAHLSPEEFQDLQSDILLRAARQAAKQGREHPRYDIPRNKAYFPGQHMKCGICGAVFYAADKGKFKCRQSIKRSRPRCWCHVQVDGAITRQKVLEWVFAQLDPFPGFRAQFINSAWEGLARLRSKRRNSTSMWSERVVSLERMAARYARAIGLTDEPDALIAELKEVSQQLTKARRERDASLQTEQDADSFLSKEDVEQRLAEALLKAASTSFQFADFLRRVLVRFDIFPVQAIDSGLVRPRAFVTLEVATPAVGDQKETVQLIDGIIDLFEPSDVIKHLSRCVEARKKPKEPGKRRTSIESLAKSLGIHHMTFKRALALARKMEKEGLSEPYRPLHEPPARASRWRARNAKSQLISKPPAITSETPSRSEATDRQNSLT